MRSIFCFLFLSLSLFTYADNGVDNGCNDELTINGIRYARGAKAFPRKVVQVYAQGRRDQLAKVDGRVLAEKNHPAIRVMHRIIQQLAENSGLERYLKNPAPIFIRFVQNEETLALPSARMDHGVFVINQEMMDLLETDDELAVIAADALLRHSLAHDLLVHHQPSTVLSRLMVRLRPAVEEPDFEKEVRLALPQVIRNAHYTPWAIPRLKYNLLMHNSSFGDTIFPVLSAEELNREMHDTVQQLEDLQIPKPTRKPGHLLLGHLRALLRGEN